MVNRDLRRRRSTFNKFNELVNMTVPELKKWKKNPKSSKAMVDRVIILKKKPFKDWKKPDLKKASLVISNIRRLKFGIGSSDALRNNGYEPFK